MPALVRRAGHVVLAGAVIVLFGLLPILALRGVAR